MPLSFLAGLTRYAILGPQAVKEELLSPVRTRVEALQNNRPLTHACTDPKS